VRFYDEPHDIKIGERAAIELIAESFNLFNRSNFNSPPDGTNARRFQIAARFRFWLAGNFADKIRAGQQTALILFL